MTVVTHLGSLVGAVKALVPMQPVDMAFERSKDVVLVRDTVVLAAAPINDLIQLGVFGWETVLDPKSCTIDFDNLGAGTTLSVGDVTYPAALAAATATSAAGTMSAVKTITIANWFQPLWQQLGYASLAAALLVGRKCVLFGAIAGAAATGNVTWQFKGQPRI